MRTKSLQWMKLACAGAAMALPLAIAGQAHAADCSTLPNPIYVGGSSAAQPFLAVVGKALASLPTPITLVYVSLGSCVGLNHIVGATAETATAIAYDSTGASATCTYPVTGGPVLDIAISDVFATTCSPAVTLPATLKDFHGPIQTMTFAVPKTSSATAISYEAAQLTFKLGDTSGTQWNTAADIWIRNSGSGTQSMIATAINLPPTGFLGGEAGAVATAQNAGSSGGVRDKLLNATGDAIDLSIGILSTSTTDINRGGIKELPYQHYGQTCGFLPDSTATALDKQNVRDGHYVIWGPLHMVAPVNAQGAPTNANAKKILDYLTGAVDSGPNFDLISTEAKGGFVPDCAMMVSHAGEVGPLASYMPAHSCECKFLFEATGAVPDVCQTCTANTDCPASRPVCNLNGFTTGYCEVQ